MVTSVLLVSFGRISDMFGRVRLFNMGFVIFTVGSLLCAAHTQHRRPGSDGADRRSGSVQGVGGAFLLSNSAAILTDAFPKNERGKALGINQTAAIAGSLTGAGAGRGPRALRLALHLPRERARRGDRHGLVVREAQRRSATIRKNQRLDVWGNVTFAAGPDPGARGGDLRPDPVRELIRWAGATRGSSPRWSGGFAPARRLPVHGDAGWRTRCSVSSSSRTGCSAPQTSPDLLASVGRGGVQIMLIILLQGIWLPLHGVSYQSTPFWAGIYMIPMILGIHGDGSRSADTSPTGMEPGSS